MIHSNAVLTDGWKKTGEQRQRLGFTQEETEALVVQIRHQGALLG